MNKFAFLVVFCYGLQHGWAFNHESASRPPPPATCWCVQRSSCPAAARAPAALLRAAACAYGDAGPYVCCDELSRQLPFTQRPPTVEEYYISHDSNALEPPDLWRATPAGSNDVSFLVPFRQRSTTYRIPAPGLDVRRAATSQPYDRRVHPPMTTSSSSSRYDGHYKRKRGHFHRPGDGITRLLPTAAPTLPARTINDPYSFRETTSPFSSQNHNPTKPETQYINNHRNTKRRKTTTQHESRNGTPSQTQTPYLKPVLKEESRPLSTPSEDNSPHRSIFESERRRISRLPQETPSHGDETTSHTQTPRPKPVPKEEPRPLSSSHEDTSPHRSITEFERRHDTSRISHHDVNEHERHHNSGRISQEKPPHHGVAESGRWHNPGRVPQENSPHHRPTISEPHNTGRVAQKQPPIRDVTESEREHGRSRVPQENSPDRDISESEKRHDTGQVSHHSHQNRVPDRPHPADSFPSNPHHHHTHSDGFDPHLFPDIEHSQSLPEGQRPPNPFPLLPPEFLENETKSTPSEHSSATTVTTTTTPTTRRTVEAVSTTTTTSRPASAYDDDAIVFPESAEIGNHGGKRWTEERGVEKHQPVSGGGSKHQGDPESHPNRSLLPSECAAALEDRIVGGSKAALGAFPWIARIGYTVKGHSRTLYRCGGTLISSRYVMTAAHCVTSLPSDFQLKGVRLGEVDARSDPDCDQVQCADPVQDFGVAAIAVHPQYDSPKFRHDVALVRLDREANFSAYVNPICLPFGDLASKNYTGLKVTVAGWGATENGTGSDELRWTGLTVVPPGECSVAYRRTRIALSDETQVCAGGAPGVDSCDGDSGGPLTLAYQPESPTGAGLPRHVVLGVVSFGARHCGSDGIPGVYTRVGAYLGWMLDNLQP